MSDHIKIRELEAWIRDKGIFSSDHVYDYGTNYFTSATRRVRKMAQDKGLIRITRAQARQAGQAVPDSSLAQWYCTPQKHEELFGVIQESFFQPSF